MPILGQLDAPRVMHYLLMRGFERLSFPKLIHRVMPVQGCLIMPNFSPEQEPRHRRPSCGGSLMPTTFNRLRAYSRYQAAKHLGPQLKEVDERFDHYHELKRL